MRKKSFVSGILAAAILMFAAAAATPVLAQENPAAQSKAPAPEKVLAVTPAAAPAKQANTPPKIDAAKEARIHELMDVTGTTSLGEQFLKTATAQLRASIAGSRPLDAHAQQLLELFLDHFQKHFDPHALTEIIVPIYDKYFSEEDLKGLLEFYRSPLGQRTLKALPEITREAQAAGFALGQQAAQAAMQEVQAEHPELMPGAKESQPQPPPPPKP
jgi:hypothetical protein